MSLKGIIKGKLDVPKRVVLTGVEGIGKTTFAAGAPSPLFLGSENGTAQLDVHRLPVATWPEILEGIKSLGSEQHDYKTVVLDTLDWAEPMLWDFICKRDKEKSIESYGYGKGYTAALDEWRIFLAELERLTRIRPMNVVLIAHTWIKPFKNPEGPDFDRYEMKLHAKAGGLIKEWADAVLFANHETFANKEEGKKTHKGVSTGARLIYTERRAAYDAKNRYGLPHSLPLSWSDFAKAADARQPENPAELKGEILRKAKLLGGDLEKDIHASVERISGDAMKMATLNSWTNAKLIERGINAAT